MDAIFDKACDFILPSYGSDFIQAIDDIQKEQNPPYSQGVFFINARGRFRQMSYFHYYFLHCLVEPITAGVVRIDQIYINASMSQYSVKKLGPEWMHYNEGIAQKYPGFCLDTDQFYITNKSAIVIDQQELIDLFCSKDIAKYEQVKDKWFGTTSLYLDQTKGKNQVVSLVTWPRSGNSMMRKHFENLLGIATGSDNSIRFAMNVTLQYSGFKAEGLVDDRCYVIKTHYPYRLPFDPPYQADFAVCCLRNPLDSFVSFFNMFMGMTHTNTIKGDFLGDELIKFWWKYLKAEVKTYKIWHDHWLRFLKETNVPVFFFRFEDILQDKQKELNEICRFILGINSIEGTVMEKRIQDVMNMDASKQQVYKPRSGTVNRNLDKYTKEMLQFVYDELEPYVHMFGYTKGDPHAQEKNTEFFDYKGKASQASLDIQSNYLKLNKEAWQKRFDMKNGKQEFKPYPINQGKYGIKLFEEFDLLSYSNPLDNVQLIQK